MKNVFLIMILFIGCNSRPVMPPAETFSTQAYHNEVAGILINCDSTITAQSIIIDSLKAKLFLSNYKIEKVKFYLNICLKNKTQDKFLKGWIKRAVQ